MDFNTHLKLFKEQELYRKANSLPFDDFTKVICDRNIISCSGDLVKSLAKIIGIDNVISTREFISIYTVAGFDRVLFGEINDTIENMIKTAREAISIIELTTNFNSDDYLKLAENCIKFKNLFGLWKDNDRDKLIVEIQESYFKLDASLSLTKLEGDDYIEWKKGVDQVKQILKDNLEIIAGKDCVTALEGMKYDVMMLDDKEQRGIALVMEKAFWDHIITEMNLGNYRSFLGLFSELTELLCVLVSNNKDLLYYINGGINTCLDKCDIQLVYNNIVFIYERIKEFGIPANDEDMSILIEKIHDDFGKIKTLDHNKVMLEYIKVAFDLIKDLISKKDEYLNKS